MNEHAAESWEIVEVLDNEPYFQVVAPHHGWRMVADMIEREEDAAKIASVPDMVNTLHDVAYFWGRDPLAFGDDATLGTIAVQFAKLADRCISILESFEESPDAVTE